MSTAELRREVASIQWYHSFDFGDGLVSHGVDNSQRKLRRLGMPARLDGKSVLDIGAWDGFFSFEAERRGAKRVLATDSFVWEGKTWGSKRGFDFAKRQLGSHVEEKWIDVMDLSETAVGTFDLVLCLGVLYHLRHPFLAIERIARVTTEVAIIETVVDLLSVARPAMAFYPGDELARDPTNWWGPNVPALKEMLVAAGFRRVDVVSGPRSVTFRIAAAAKRRWKQGHRFWPMVRTDRVVVHAWK